MLWLFRGVFLSVSLFIFLTPAAFAHPIDDLGTVQLYDQWQTIDVSQNNVNLTIKMQFYALEKIKVWESIDSNNDRKVSDQESTDWMQRGKRDSWIEFNSSRVDFEPTELVFPSYTEFFKSGPSVVEIIFSTPHQSKINESVRYVYQGKDRQLQDIEVTINGGENLKPVDISKDTPESIIFRLQEGAPDSAVLGTETSDRLQSFLNKYVKQDSLPPMFIFWAFGTAFVLGALHALTPGHGKAMVAGYLVGERGTIVHALHLGWIITVTHTASVFALGLVALFLMSYILPEDIVKPLHIISALIILGFGVVLLFQRGKEVWSNKSTQHDHHDHHHAHDHDHEHSHDHNHHDEPPTLTFKNLLPLGIAGGIVPCVDALAILIVAISLQKLLLGLLLLVMFSLGLATTLIAAGVIVVLAKDHVAHRIPGVARWQKYVSVFSAIFITIVGVLLLLEAW